MFKERLKITCKEIGCVLMEMFILVLILSTFVATVILIYEFPIMYTITKWFIYIFIGFIGLVILAVSGLCIYLFIEWLFIEPYREKKKINSYKEENENDTI